MQCPQNAPYMHSDGLCYPEEEGQNNSGANGQNNLSNGYNMEGGARRRRSTRKAGRKGTTRKSRQNARQNVAARKNRQNTMRKNRRNGRKDRR